MGMGMARSMPLASIKSLGTKKKRIGNRAFFGPAGMNDISDGQSGNLYLYIDGEQYIETCKTARASHVYYAKYFISHFVKEERQRLKDFNKPWTP